MSLSLRGMVPAADARSSTSRNSIALKCNKLSIHRSYLMDYTPEQISLFRNERKKELNKCQFRLRNFPNVQKEEVKLTVLRFIKAITDVDLSPLAIVSCERTLGYFRREQDVIVTFSEQRTRDRIFRNLPRFRVKFLGKSVHIYDELSCDAVRIMKDATERFGMLRVLIVNGTVGIRKDERRVFSMPSLIQYRRFLRFLKSLKLATIGEENEL